MGNTIRVAMLLSVQRALLGEVTCNLDAVAISWSEKSIRISFFYRLPPEEEDRESAEIVATEVIADFPEYNVSVDKNLMDESISLPEGAVWVFRRKQR
jgi:hypothetical protein